MKPRLLDHVVCPLDKTSLELREWEIALIELSPEDLSRAERLGIVPAKLAREIITGVLVNPARKLLYPIHRGVPRLLTFSTGVARESCDRYAVQVRRDFPGYSLPNEPGMPGEADVLRTFSSEWLNYDWTGQSYWNLAPDAWFRCMRFVLGLDRRPVQDKLTLEVGIGIGGVADYMAREEGCEIVGVDLGYAVDAACAHFGKNPFLHIVQASAFTPPFRDRSFDFVYSFGVLHHTFSTKAAFDRLAPLPKDRGRLYVWVYSPHDESRTLERRALMCLERILRPLIWRLPDKAQSIALAPLVPLYMVHQWLYSIRHRAGAVRYGVREALHAARDRFTPRYIHRHTEEELSGWFAAAGFGELERGRDRPRPDYVPIAFTASTGVSGIRK